MDTKQEYPVEDVKFNQDADQTSSEGQLDGDDPRYKEIERQLKRKFDIRLIPCFWIMYFFTSIDRSNVGSAIIMNKGIGHDLQTVTKLSGSQVSLGVALFYVGFVIFELPSNMLLTKIPASKWLATIMILWGIITTLMVLIKNEATYFVLRFLLGAIEAGLFPGMAFIMSRFFLRTETGVRMGLYFFSGPVASIFGAFFSAAFQLVDGHAGLYGYQWLFLVFGLATVVAGAIIFIVLPSTPYDNGLLTAEEAQVQRHRMMRQNQHLNTEFKEEFSLRALFTELADYKVYLFAIIFLSTVLITTSMQYYAQTIVLQMGFTSIKAALMNVPAGAMVCISCLVVTKMSDKFRCRSYPYMLFALISAVGFIILSFTTTVAARYAGLLVVCLGIGPGVPLAMSWAVSAKDGELSIAISTALITAIAQLGTVFSTFFLYAGWPSDAPRYIGSNSVNIGLACLGFVIAFIIRLDLKRLNRMIDNEGQTKNGRTSRFLL